MLTVISNRRLQDAFFPQMHPRLFLVRTFAGADLFMRRGEYCTVSHRHLKTHLFMLFTGCVEGGGESLSCKTALVVFQAAIFVNVRLGLHAAVPLQVAEKAKALRRHRQTSWPVEKTGARRVLMQFPAPSSHRKQRNSRSQIHFICFLLIHVPRRYSQRFHRKDTTII